MARVPWSSYLLFGSLILEFRLLILTRGYGGGDEAKLLNWHLHGTSAKIGVGANGAATAATFLERYGRLNSKGSPGLESNVTEEKVDTSCHSDQIGVAILDDGMQVY